VENSIFNFAVAGPKRRKAKKCRLEPLLVFFSGNLINWLCKKKIRERDGEKIDQTMRHFTSIFNFAAYGLIWFGSCFRPKRARSYPNHVTIFNFRKTANNSNVKRDLSTRGIRNLIKSHRVESQHCVYRKKLNFRRISDSIWCSRERIF
jgi:hypothetical protein